MFNIVSVFLGGGIGSVLRHLVCLKISSHWGVMLVNILGAMMIGMAMEFFMTRTDLRPELRSLVVTGMLGGFTTFSTYILNFGNLMNNQRVTEAMLYLFGSLLVGILFLFAGAKIAKIWW